MDDSIVGVCIERKLFTVCFTRGQGYCYDEVTYVIFDTDIENVKKRVQEYFIKHFSKGDWLVGISELTLEDDDEDGFYYVAGRYS